jgi:hypothetical protein
MEGVKEAFTKSIYPRSRACDRASPASGDNVIDITQEEPRAPILVHMGWRGQIASIT